MLTPGTAEGAPRSVRFVDLAPCERRAFWRWLACEIWTAPEFAMLTPRHKAALTKLLLCVPGDHGAH